MALPKQIQQQADAVAQLEEQLAAQGAQENPNPTPPPEEPKPEPTEVVAEQGNPEPAAQPVEAPKKVEDPWEHRYKTLQGMFSSMQTQHRDALEQLREAQAQIREIQQSRTAPPKTAVERLVTPKDVETFGEDLVDLARRVARDEFGDREVAYQAEIKELRGQLAGQFGEVQKSQQRTAQEMFFDRLSATVPNWESIQATEECQAWLGTRPAGVRVTWNDLLNDAAKNRDLSGVVEIFQAFEATRPAAPQVPDPAIAAKAKTSNELQRQVTPGKSKSNTAAPAQPRVYTMSEYEQESMKIIRARKAGNVDLAQQIQNELDAALNEGRIRP